MSIITSRGRAALGLAVAAVLALGGTTPASASTSTSASGDGVSAAATKYRTIVKVKVKVGKRSVRFSACATVDAYATYVVRYKAKARKTTDRVYGSVNLTLGGASSRTSNASFGLFPGHNTVSSRILDAKAADVLSVTVKLKGKKKSRQIAVGSLRPC